jgi:hypothetical protein
VQQFVTVWHAWIGDATIADAIMDGPAKGFSDPHELKPVQKHTNPEGLVCLKTHTTVAPAVRMASEVE